MDETSSAGIGEDYLIALRRSPKAAIAELIWNGLDADATQVSVEYELNALGGVEAVTVCDNGTGMTPADARLGFGSLVCLPKRTAASVPGGREVRGRLGLGRFTAYAIGAHVVWTSVADDDGIRRRLTVTGSGATLRNVYVSDAEPTDAETGTVVRIGELSEGAERELLDATIWEDLTSRFAPYLAQHGASVTFRGRPLSLGGLLDRAHTERIRVDGAEATLAIIAWNIKVEQRLYLCDENGTALTAIVPAVETAGCQVTAYLRWAGFREPGNDILLAEMDSGPAGELIAAAEDHIRAWVAEGSSPDFGDQRDPVRKSKAEGVQTLPGRSTQARVTEVDRRIADRLNFLTWLEEVLFDPAAKEQTLERRQVHRILAYEAWAFGEEWALPGDDYRLAHVLAAHLPLLGDDVDLDVMEPVRPEDDREAVGDLVMSRTMQPAADKYEHLVVELKRPAHTVTSGDVEQLRSFAVAIACDGRFRQSNMHWTYVLVGDSVTPGVDDQRQQLHLPYGCVQVWQKYSIWVRTWAEVISDARNRLKFAQQTLDYETAHGRRYGAGDLRRRRHDQYLPPAMAAAVPAAAAGTLG